MHPKITIMGVRKNVRQLIGVIENMPQLLMGLRKNVPQLCMLAVLLGNVTTGFAQEDEASFAQEDEVSFAQEDEATIDSSAVVTNSFWDNWYGQVGADMILLFPVHHAVKDVFPNG